MTPPVMEVGEVWTIKFSNAERAWYYLCCDINKKKNIVTFCNLDDGKICAWQNWSITHSDGSLYQWKKVK